MSLDKFIASEVNRIEAFKAHWTAMNAKEGAERWPMVMREPDWDEMLVTFKSK